jgi:hypothetical protein
MLRVELHGTWKWEDWSKLPDSYNILIFCEKSVPRDYRRDHAALMERLEDPTYVHMICWNCVINIAQEAKKELDRLARFWSESGGEAAKQRFFEEAGEPYTSSFRRSDGMRQVEWRIYNELAEANNRTCEVMNYFHCPFGDAWHQLLEDGRDAKNIWEHIQWYDDHWNRNTYYTPRESEMKWYHYNEPPIIDVANYDDILRAIDDGRLDKIITEHLRYMKETGRKILDL